MRRNATYFGKKMTNLYTNTVLDWENERLFQDNPLEKIETRKGRAYYHYSSWFDVHEKFDSGQVLSAFLLEMHDGEHLVVAFGSHRRSGLVSLSKLTQLHGRKDTTSLGLNYATFDLSLENDCMTNVALEQIEKKTKAHCLLLPYKLPNTSFNKQFAIVYDDWDTVSFDGIKTNVEPCPNVLKV